MSFQTGVSQFILAIGTRTIVEAEAAVESLSVTESVEVDQVRILQEPVIAGMPPQFHGGHE